MSKRIITISREFGSGGRYIGKCVAEKLGFKFYDKEIIEKLADETGLAKEFIEKNGEYAPSKSIFSYAFVARDQFGSSMSDYLHRAQVKIIKEIADEEPCVIVGRGADYILKERPDLINIFIHGNMPQKLQRITELYSLTEAEAKKRIKETDKKRSVNYNYYTEREWGNLKNYTMALNSSELGLDKCVDIICNTVK